MQELIRKMYCIIIRRRALKKQSQNHTEYNTIQNEYKKKAKLIHYARLIQNPDSSTTTPTLIYAVLFMGDEYESEENTYE